MRILRDLPDFGLLCSGPRPSETSMTYRPPRAAIPNLISPAAMWLRICRNSSSSKSTQSPCLRTCTRTPSAAMHSIRGVTSATVGSLSAERTIGHSKPAYSLGRRFTFFFASALARSPSGDHSSSAGQLLEMPDSFPPQSMKNGEEASSPEGSIPAPTPRHTGVRKGSRLDVTNPFGRGHSAASWYVEKQFGHRLTAGASAFLPRGAMFSPRRTTSSSSCLSATPMSKASDAERQQNIIDPAGAAEEAWHDTLQR
mmetsp:Transcript_96603/g.277410  ORF Transcript_96603/g.277410 Transcript_96603/m.277410 type:complete len:255 (-) Transcript_96603:20-784(-)